MTQRDESEIGVARQVEILTGMGDMAGSPQPGQEGRFVFGIDVGVHVQPGRYGVSCWRDHCWRGMVVADTLEEACEAAVRWHVTGVLE